MDPAQSVRNRRIVGTRFARFLRQSERRIDTATMLGVVPSQIIGRGGEVFVELKNFLIRLIGLGRLFLQIAQNADHHLRGDRLGILSNNLLVLLDGRVKAFLRRVGV